MKKLAALAAVLVLVLVGCSKGEDKVDLNPGKGNDGVGNPAKPGDQGDKNKG